MTPKDVDLIRLRAQIALGIGWIDGPANSKRPGYVIAREAMVDAWNTCTQAIGDGLFAPPDPPEYLPR